MTCGTAPVTAREQVNRLVYYATRVGSMGGLFFNDERVVDYDAAQRCDTQRYAAYFHGMLEEGVYLAPSQFEAYFFSDRHGDDELERTLEAQRTVLERIHA